MVYVAGHAHDCERIGGFPDTTNPRGSTPTGSRSPRQRRRTLQHEDGSYYDFGGQPAPTLLHWFPDFTVGTYTGPEPRPVACGGGRQLRRRTAGSSSGSTDKPAGRLGALRPGRGRAQRRRSATERGGNGLTGSASVGSIRLQWPANHDRDNTRLTYRLYRDNVQISQTTADSTFWSRPNLSYTDRSVVRDRTYAYKLTAADPYGNLQTSSIISIRAR